MKICVLVPNQDQLAQAGVRIRYSRIAPALVQLGHQLDLLPLQELAETSQRDHDVYLISKCYDARALLVARQLTQVGKLVGVDLFDDYFSQYSDSRFVRLRYWLRALVSQCAFALCSTTSMRNLALQYAPTLPVHVLNDPAAAIDASAIGSAVTTKLDIARATRTIQLAWFGMGDNPNFPVGLADLTAFGGEIDRLRGQGYAVHLDVLTNRRAMTADALAALSGLATPYRLEEWTEAREEELLARSLVSFLPVNAQRFSRVKSLNRAVTALSAGVQVLSAGYPLYTSLNPFIYRDGRKLVHDLRSGTTVLRPDTAQGLTARLRVLANTGYEAETLLKFLADVKPCAPSATKAGRTAVIHCKEVSGDIHKFTQKTKALSVASPFSRTGLKYDLVFSFSPNEGGIDIAIRDKVVGAIDKRFKSMLIPSTSMPEYQSLASKTLFTGESFQDLSMAGLKTLCSDTAAYPVVMRSVVHVLQQLFPNISCFHAEQSKFLPWHVDSTPSILNSTVAP